MNKTGFGPLYAYREKATGHYASFQVYHSKSPATSGLWEDLRRKLTKRELREDGSFDRWDRPTKDAVKAYAKEHFELVTFDLVPRP